MKDVFVNRHGEVRAGWRIALFVVLISLSSAALISPMIGLNFLSNLLASIALTISILASSFIMTKFVNKKPFRAIGLGVDATAFRNFGVGVLLGFLMIAAIFIVQASAGFVEVSSAVDSFGDLSATVLMATLLFMVAAFWEEALFRGYLFQTMIQAITFLPAMLLMAILFAVAHASNPNASWLAFVNVALAGVWLSFAYMKTRNLWLPFGLHFGWNFSQTTVFGFPTSGMELAQYRLLSVTQSGPEWLTGAEFGPEGGVFATVALVACTWYILKSKTLVSPKGAITLDSIEDLVPSLENHGGGVRNA